MTKTKTSNGAGHALGLKRNQVIKLWNKLRSIAGVARELKCSASTIRYHLVASGLLPRK
jgi:hypothetical protein